MIYYSEPYQPTIISPHALPAFQLIPKGVKMLIFLYEQVVVMKVNDT